MMERIQGTCVALNGQAVLLQGQSGCGKSDLALRLIDDGWNLVSDDYTEIHLSDGVLLAHPPKAIVGMLEIRGLGIVRAGCVPQAEIKAVFDLVPFADIERLPETTTKIILNQEISHYFIYGHGASAPAIIRMALKAKNEHLFVSDTPQGG